MRTRTRGIQLAEGGSRIVNKEYKGQRIFQRSTQSGRTAFDAAVNACGQMLRGSI
jgi:hypothetical protein